MKNNTSFPQYLQQIITDKQSRIDAVVGMTFLFVTFFGLAFTIALYNIITGK